MPAALLTFAWDAAVQADIAAAGGKSSAALLKPELLERIQTLSWAERREGALWPLLPPPSSSLAAEVKLPLGAVLYLFLQILLQVKDSSAATSP